MNKHEMNTPLEQAIEALKVIHKTVRGDEKSECWTIRKYLDDHDIFNDDIQGSERLVELVCKYVIEAVRLAPLGPHTCHGNEHMPPGPCRACEEEKAEYMSETNTPLEQAKQRLIEHLDPWVVLDARSGEYADGPHGYDLIEALIVEAKAEAVRLAPLDLNINVQEIAAIAWRCIRECKDYEGPPVMCPAHQEEAKALIAKARLAPLAEQAKLKRYDLITNYRCGSAIEEMERNDEDGEWVRFDDVEPLARLAPLGRQEQPDTDKEAL